MCTCEGSQITRVWAGNTTQFQQLPLLSPVGDGEDDGHQWQHQGQSTREHQGAKENVEQLQTQQASDRLTQSWEPVAMQGVQCFKGVCMLQHSMY